MEKNKNIDIMDNSSDELYISKIGHIVDKAHKVSFEVFFDDIKIFELENGMIVLLSMRDGTGNMSAVLMGDKSPETMNTIKDINLKDKYLITGNIPFDLDYVYMGLLERIKDDKKIKKEMLKNKVLFVKAIQKIEHKKSKV